MLWQTIFLAAESNAPKFPQNMKLTVIKLGIPRYQRTKERSHESAWTLIGQYGMENLRLSTNQNLEPIVARGCKIVSMR